MKYMDYKHTRVMQWERKFLTKTLAEHNGNASKAARHLEMDRANFLRLLKKHNIDRLSCQTFDQNSFKDSILK